MKKTTSGSLHRKGGRPRRLGVAEMKAHLSEALRELAAGPTLIHNRGRDVAVLIGIDDYDRLAASSVVQETSGRAFVDEIEALKRLRGHGVDDFEPPRLVLMSDRAFRQTRRKRK